MIETKLYRNENKLCKIETKLCRIETKLCKIEIKLCRIETKTYMSVIVQLVIGELELVEGHNLLHPLSSFSRRVWMNMYPGRRIRIRFPRHHPARGVEGVSVPFIVTRDKVHDEHVVLHGVEAEQPHLIGREHSAAGFCHDHFRSQFVKLLPEGLHLEVDLDSG